jgi:hypothetical protein
MSGKHIKSAACLLTSCLSAGLASGCAHAAPSTSGVVVPYMPPAYYTCIETTVNDLLNAYFIDTRNNEVLWGAEDAYNGKVFVFKNAVITPTDMKDRTAEYIWIDGRIKCYGLSPGVTSKLSNGERVDIVGTNAGLSQEYSGSIVFTGCVFLPAGYVQLPSEQGSGLGPASIY